MTRTHIASCIAAAVAASLLSPVAHADSTWSGLSGIYDTPSNWSPTGVPADTANLLFAPSTPSTAYTVTLAASHTANRAIFQNNPATFDLNFSSMNLTQTSNAFNNASLVIAQNSSLAVANGTFLTNSIQIGSASTAPSQPTFLTINDTATLQTSANVTISNYQTLNVLGTLFVGNGALITQSPDLPSTHLNTAALSVSGPSGYLSLGDYSTLRGGSLSVSSDATLAYTGNVTFDSLLYLGNLTLSTSFITTNLASTLHDAANATIPTTIAGQLTVTDGTLNMVTASVRTTADSGSTFTPFSVLGVATLTLFNTSLATGLLTFDGSGTGSQTSIASSAITVHGNLQLGENGNATVQIKNASTVTLTGALLVGDKSGSIGSLTLSNVGVLSASATSNIGNLAGSTGIVIVQDPGSSLSSAAELDVGNVGTGSLTISNSASVSDNVGRIGTFAGSNGTVLINNASWNHASFFEIADSGTASLTLQNNARLSANIINMAYYAGSSASATVDHSAIVNSGFLTVGNSGAALLSLQNAGSLTSTNLNIAFNAGSSGSLSISGSARATFSGFITVGSGGNGTLSLASGGVATATSTLTVGRDNGSRGVLLLDGTASSLTTTSLVTVGQSGIGSLSITNGALLFAGNNSAFSTATTSTATLLITGSNSRLVDSTQVTIGQDGNATATVSNGGLISANGTSSPTGAALILGLQNLGAGSLTVTGTNSQVLLAGHMVVGLGNNSVSTANGGYGSLSLAAGALLSDTNGYIGRYAGSKGIASISNALWQNSGNFFIAANDTANNPANASLLAGTGTLTLLPNGTLTTTSATLGATGILSMQGGLLSASSSITLNGLIQGFGSISGPITSGSGSLIASNGNLTTDAVTTAAISANANCTLTFRASGASPYASKTPVFLLSGATSNWTGTLDLTRNALIVAATAANKTNTASTLLNQLTFSKNNGAWNRPGISSSTVAANPTKLTVGLFDNADLNLPSYLGQPLDSNSLLAATTQIGDANLDHNVDLADYDLWYKHVGGTANATSRGDFNLDGNIDLADYDAWYTHVGASFPLSAQSSSLITSSTTVPEPATLTIPLLALLLHTRRTRRRPHGASQ